MRIALIVAMARGRVIGRNGRMPWHIPAELRYFRRVTTGHAVIMGRRTFESIGRPLPSRYNIVLTRRRNWSHAGAARADDLDAALVLARAASQAGFDPDTAFVIGGAEVYAAALPRASFIYATRIDAEVEGDTLFPELDESAWQLASSEREESSGFNLCYEVRERRRATAETVGSGR